MLLIAGSAWARVKTGTYTGDGAASRSFTGVGFPPAVVIIKGNDVGSPDDLTSAVLRSGNMPAGLSKPLKGDQALVSTAILSLDADGFTVGGDRRVNAAGIQFHYVAFEPGPNMALGTYTGTGGSQSVTSVGFSPDYLILMEATASRAFHHSYHWNQSLTFNNDSPSNNAVTSLNPTGFTVGNDQHVNESSRVYYYVAWQEVPGQMRVSWYLGNSTDNRPIAAGLQPEYVIVRRIDGGGEAFQRFSSMAGDASVNFKGTIQTNHIQALQSNGFQIGTGAPVNGAGAYFFAAFGNGNSPGLTTTEAPGTLTVTAPDYFDLTFSTAAGGGIEEFHDLLSGENDGMDLAAGQSVMKSLVFDAVSIGGSSYNTGQNDIEPKIDLLEATGTRVKVRQEAFYQLEGGVALASGIKGLGDYSIYPTGRMAVRWDRRTTKTVATQSSRIGLAVHKRQNQQLSGWTAWSETAALPTPGGPGTDLFVMAGMNDVVYGTYTDFLQVLYRRWTAANSTEWLQTPMNGREWGAAFWQESDGQTLPALERWDSVVHFKPTNLVDRTDPNVLARRDDYRSPDPLSIAVGSGWNENTADGDFYNESEGAYTLQLDPANGLRFDIDGNTIRRREPFFKVRNWRSLQKPSSVTLESAPLTVGSDYRADVKPLSRGHLAAELLWHSTLESAAAVANPDVGSPGAVNGGTTFANGRYGNGALLSAAASNVSFPAAGNLRVDRGSVELWYLPSYYYVDGIEHRIWTYFVDAANQFRLTKAAAGNNLEFEILRAGVSTKVSVTVANYGWLDHEWVHLRAAWDSSAPLADQVRIFVNRVEPPHTNPTNAYNSAGMPVSGTVLIGGNGTVAANGVIDEVHVYGGPSSTTDLAHGGLAAHAAEYLATGARNTALSFAPVDALRRGPYVYFAADSPFRGLNVTLAVPGAGTPRLAWEFWNGTRWADLESVAGFTDETLELTRDGAIYWSAEPSGWSEVAVDGDADLFYVRAHLESGGSYTTFPEEREIRTDILLFQYAKDVAFAGATFELGAPLGIDVTISSVVNQSFVVGEAVPVSAAAITITDVGGGIVTPAGDIRIRIPAGFPLRWDAAVSSVSLGGSAAGKVDPLIQAYEDLDQTLVLAVTASFAAGDRLVVSGLQFEGFLHPAPADSLELEVEDDGSIAAFDDKTVTVTATGSANLSSHDDQLFTVGQAPTPARTLYVTEGTSTLVLTAANDFLIEIPVTLPMEWDASVTSVSVTGPAASRVMATVTYPSTRTVRLNVTSSFAPGEHVAIDGLRFRNFTASAPASNLRLQSPAGTGVDADDKTIRIESFGEVPFFTATATDSQVRLEWVNPSMGLCLDLHLVRREGGFPANPSDGAPIASLPCVAGQNELVDDTTVVNDTTYYYALFVEHTAGLFTAGKHVKARPFDTSGPVKWAYSTGATSMAPPGLRFGGGSSFVYVVSNDNILHAVNGGPGGGSWPSGWTPYAVGSPVQARPPVLGFSVGASSNGIALLGSQDGSVHAVNAATGALEWQTPVAGMVQAAPAGNFSAFDPTALDFVLVGTRNAAGSNELVFLDLVTGNFVRSFSNSPAQNGTGQGIGIISSSASVHYPSKHVYFASRALAGGSSHTLWAVDFAANPPQRLWSAPIGNIDGSPVRFGAVVYVGTNSGDLYALDAATGAVNWSLSLSDGPIKGFVFPNFATGDLFVATNSKLWSVSDDGTSASINTGWPVTAAQVVSPSTPVPVPGGDVFVGGGNGTLYQLDPVTPLPLSSVVLGEGTTSVGVPSVDLLTSMVYVGTDEGVIYGVLFPLP
jgi:outer membrane protein assembly factor BamB